MFKCGNERSKAVASRLLHSEDLRRRAEDDGGVQEMNFEALRRNVGVDLRKDIPGYSMALTRRAPREGMEMKATGFR